MNMTTYLQQEGLSVAESVVLLFLLQNGHTTAADAAQTVANYCSAFSHLEANTEEEISNAICTLRDDGLLQIHPFSTTVIGQSTLDSLHESSVCDCDGSELNTLPLDGIPSGDDIDVSIEAASLALRLYSTDPDDFDMWPAVSWCANEDGLSPTLYSSSRAEAERGVYDYAAECGSIRKIVSCEYSSECGPFFQRWWLYRKNCWQVRLAVEASQ